MSLADSTSLDLALLQARTFNKFTTEPVTDEKLHQLYDLLKWGPTSMNCQPARYVFVRSPEAKARLKGQKRVARTCGREAHGVSGQVVGEDDRAHGGLARARLAHQQHLLLRHRAALCRGGREKERWEGVAPDIPGRKAS